MCIKRIAGRDIAVGLAYCSYIPSLLKSDPGIVDYIEVPFELLLRSDGVLDDLGETPVLLHCASLSLAGNLPVDKEMFARLKEVVARTNTPWIGEHLAFVRASSPESEPSMADAVLVDPVTGSYNVGYTVSPQYSEEILERVSSAVSNAEDRLGVPVLLENGPLYIDLPGSTMTQAEFIEELHHRNPATKFLLDLSHLEITAQNSGCDVYELLSAIPAEAVVEVHLSGHSSQSGLLWDDHAQRAPKIMFDLLSSLLEKANPRAITLEYNWDASFPLDGLREDVARVRHIVDHV